MQVSSLFAYPVKSMCGSALGSALVQQRGLAGDRRWMVVDEQMRFITRREHPTLARFQATVTDTGVTLSHPDAGSLHCAFPSREVTVHVWRDTVTARIAKPEVSAFLSRVMGRSVHLVYQSADDERRVDQKFAGVDDQVSFADGFPLLITTAESLAAINARLAHAIPMDRFRPNLVLTGAEGPWVEQTWRRIRIGKVVLRLVKPCTRCVVTTQDHLTGERNDGNEPLATLRALGQWIPAGVIFGQNAVPETLGDIRVGDGVDILDPV